MTTVGVIGLGAMGSAAADRLIELGFDTVLYDIVAERMENFPTAMAAENVSDLSGRSDIILAFLPYSYQVEDIAIGENGVIYAARPGTVFINMSTISPNVIKKVADVLEKSGIETLGAPMNGGPPVLRAGKLSLVVGGDEKTLEKCRNILEALGQIQHIGGIGAGEVAKLVNNLILTICIQANTEGIVLGAKFGVDPEKLVQSVIEGVGFNHAMRKHFKNHVLTGDFSENGLFSVDYMRKDLAVAFDLADELKVPLLFGRLADQMYQGARAAGYSEKYHPVVSKVLADLCGVNLQTKSGQAIADVSLEVGAGNGKNLE